MRPYDLDSSEHSFSFTRNWFRNRNLGTFREHILPTWAGKSITYLELGVFEGMSSIWMLQHILTHPTARLVGVDPWLMTTKLSTSDMEAVYTRAKENLEPWNYPIGIDPNGERLFKRTLVRGNSCEVLRRMCRKGYAGIHKESLDLCMVDGNHFDYAVLDDARHVYKLMKRGGHIIFDDVENDRDKKDHVKDGLEMFLEEHPKKVELVFKQKYVECYEKVL